MLSRRTFLALSVGVVVGGCSSSESAAEETSSTTGDGARAIDAATSTATPTATPTATTEATANTVALAGDPFRLGVASGDPLPDSVILWTRLVADDLPDEVSVGVEVALDEDFADLVAGLELTARGDDAHSIHAQIDGLAADQWYWYRFNAGGFVSPAGRTRTMPADDVLPDSFSFASASCQNWEDGFYTAHGDIAAAGLDLVFWLGDYIYEGAANPIRPASDGEAVVRSHDGPEPTDLDSYRARYALYKSDRLLQAAHLACPWIVTWDDHEVENNYAGDDQPGRGAGRAVPGASSSCVPRLVGTSAGPPAAARWPRLHDLPRRPDRRPRRCVGARHSPVPHRPGMR